MKISHIAIATALSVAAGLACAQAPGASCDTKSSATQRVARFDADMNDLRAAQKQRETVVQKQMDDIGNRMVASKRWTKAQRGSFLVNVMGEPAIAKFESDKMAMFGKFMEAGPAFEKSKKQGDPTKACAAANSMYSMLEQIGKINDQEYALMLESMQKAESGKK
ncbi:hypothetical protein [Massilia glaciei]|uniref:Uncharacterized protein n=1 Tax=Massilia glaciei TaxID=1524097 RepID=A0A2U2HMA7_9BURK|nr:hypothetical protein [Massilia glaciei]PWF48609.1 hypothetical protein C7C56_010925 [Massilia glaciei]